VAKKDLFAKRDRVAEWADFTKQTSAHDSLLRP
jgi:hypothetical protein